MSQNKHKREPQQPVNTFDDNQMIAAGLRQPLVERLPKELFANSKEQKKEFKKLAKLHPLENRVMLSSRI